MKNIVCIFLLVFCSDVLAVEIYTPDKILKIAEKSKNVYEIVGEDKDFIKEKTTGYLIPGEIQFIKKDGGKYSIGVYELSDKADLVIAKAEEAFKEQKYAQAIELYEKVKRIDPGYLIIDNYIGDAYFMMKEYEKAKGCFENAIKVNYLNYQAHWFLADTLWELGRKKEALNEITKAHILNIYHPEVKKIMINYRKQSGIDWDTWSYVPQCEIKKSSGKKISIRATLDWVTYGMTKALWKFEPGYASEHLDNKTAKESLIYIEEAEAFLARAASADKKSKLDQIAKCEEEGCILNFVSYEIKLKDDPVEVLKYSSDRIEGIVRYINKHH